MIDSVLKIVRGIVGLRGSTDNTLIGNTGDRLKVDNSAADKTGSGTITSGTTPNDVVTANTQGMGSVVFNVTGTWVGTMRVEGTVDSGATWLLMTAVDASQAVFATQTTNNRWQVACGGYSQVRLRMSSYTSGSASVVWNTGAGLAPLLVWNTNATSLKTGVRSDPLNLSGSAGSLNADIVAAIDIEGYSAVELQITGTWVGTLTFQGSNNNIDFISVLATDISNATNSPITFTTSNGIFYIPTNFRYFRCRMTSYTSGTATSTSLFETLTSNDLQNRNTSIIGGTDNTKIGNTGDRLKTETSLFGVVDASNSTTTNLGIGGIFTGAWVDILNYNNVVVTVNANQSAASLGLSFEWSNNGSTVHSSDDYNYNINTKKQYSFGRLSRYYRVVYTNGAVAQTSFSLQTILSNGNLKPSSHRIDDNVVADDDAELVKSVVTGKRPDGSYGPINIDINGNFIVTALTGFGADFSFGDVTTSSLNLAIVRRTTYTEQISSAQRSIVSASANDTSAGTGARTIKITYLDSTGAGPYTEIITMNGTSAVNTVNTNICFIEQIEVVTAGSTGSNVGIISLKAATAGGGVTVGTIAATDNQTFWAHHYIPISKTMNITGVAVSHNGTTVGSGGVFTVNAKTIGVTNAIDTQISDFIRLYGQASTFSRNYSSPIKMAGPARVLVYITPETASSTVYRASVDFFET